MMGVYVFVYLCESCLFVGMSTQFCVSSCLVFVCVSCMREGMHVLMCLGTGMQERLFVCVFTFVFCMYGASRLC